MLHFLDYNDLDHIMDLTTDFFERDALLPPSGVNHAYIKCRACAKIKPAHRLHFETVRASNVFRTTCRKCRVQQAYPRTVAAKMAELRMRVGLSPAEREAKMAKVRDDVAYVKRARLQAFAADQFDHDFKKLWTCVRTVIARRRAMLQNVVQTSKAISNGSTSRRAGAPARRLALMMDNDARVKRYMETVLDTYSNIVRRLQDLDGWRRTIGDHLPPGHWLTVLPGIPSGDNEMLLWVSPWEFATRIEMERLRAEDPYHVQPQCVDWCNTFTYNSALGYKVTQRANGTVHYHVYPAQTKRGGPYNQRSPNWLIQFQGSTKPDGWEG